MNLEKQILDNVAHSLGEAIKASLTSGYHNNPLHKMVTAVVESRETEIRKVVEEAMDGALVGDFREALKDAVTHKLARVLTSKMEGEIEKRANELRSSPEVRAKITLAISGVLKKLAA